MSVVVVQEMSGHLRWLCKAIHKRLLSGECPVGQVLDHEARDSGHQPKAEQLEQAELVLESLALEVGRNIVDAQMRAAARHLCSPRSAMTKVKQK